MNKSIACIAAHPDDIEFAMGGTVILLREQGYSLHYIVLTSGQAGIKGKVPDDACEIRESEQMAAADAAGAEVTFYRQMDGELFAGRELCSKVGEELKKIDPAAVFAFWPLNVPDHSAAYEVAQKACHCADIYYTTEFYLYETSIGGQTNQFEPDIYVNISEVYKKKIELLRLHTSQTGSSSDEDLLFESRCRGAESRVDYAEGFKPVHKIANRRWGRKSGYLLLDL